MQGDTGSAPAGSDFRRQVVPAAAASVKTASEVQLLIVDDEEVQQVALCTVLSVAGYTTRGFSSGASALEALRHQKFHLALTDLSMPGIGGIELLQAARQIDPELVGIVMTGHGAIDTAIDAMKAGALDYILKPFSMSDILRVLERALGVRRLRIENASLQLDLLRHMRELESANAELEAFSHSVSHDLRAPLRAVADFAQILEINHGASMPPEALQLMRKITAGAVRMLQLIEGKGAAF